MIRKYIAQFLLWVLKPGLAPMIAELERHNTELQNRKIGWEDVDILTDNKLRINKELRRMLREDELERKRRGVSETQISD